MISDQRQEIFRFFKESRPAFVPTNHYVQWAQELETIDRYIPAVPPILPSHYSDWAILALANIQACNLF
jgi:hypothetical protein